MSSRPTGLLLLADGSVFYGQGLGAAVENVGELCFNTSITGYQEIMTDPSYAAQIITFTFPHIGNVGANDEDIEATNQAALGCVLACDISRPSNWRATQSFSLWMAARRLPGIAGIDTRALTRRMRDAGVQHAFLSHKLDGEFGDLDVLREKVRSWGGLEGKDLAIEVGCRQAYRWDQGLWPQGGQSQHHKDTNKYRIVAIDYGVKRNILRNLVDLGAEVIVVPGQSSAQEILSHHPDGIFLSNGPGDPAATGRYAVPVLKELIKTGLPIFGICLGHQMLALAYGGKTVKMSTGHRGANHPVKNLQDGKVEITSQNHGFSVLADSLPKNVTVTHLSLFDGTIEGMEVVGKPIFSVQYHPEASPGPQDSHYLFKRFMNLVAREKLNT